MKDTRQSERKEPPFSSQVSVEHLRAPGFPSAPDPSFFPSLSQRASYEYMRFPRRMSAKYRLSPPPLSTLRTHTSTVELSEYTRLLAYFNRPRDYTREFFRKGTYPLFALFTHDCF